jgi:hypothetical protein
VAPPSLSSRLIQSFVPGFKFNEGCISGRRATIRPAAAADGIDLRHDIPYSRTIVTWAYLTPGGRVTHEKLIVEQQVKQFSDFTFTLGLFLAYSSYFEEIKVGL